MVPGHAPGIAKSNAHHLQKAADADHEQTHGKQKPQLLRDRRKNKVRFHIGNVLRCTLPDSQPEPAAPGQGKKRLGDLIALTVDHAPGITPCLYPHLHMGKQAVRHAGRRAPAGSTQRKITVFSRREENKEDKNEEKNKCASQIPGKNQHQHMTACHSRSNRQIFQRSIFPQKRCEKKNEQKLDKLRRLKGDPRHRIADSGAVGHLSQNQHSGQGQKTCTGIQKSQLLKQLLPFSYHIWNRHGNDHAGGRNDELTDRLLQIQPAENQQTGPKEEAHMIEKRPVHSRIDHEKQHHGSEQGNLGKRIKKQGVQLSRFQTKRQKSDKLPDKNADGLRRIHRPSLPGRKENAYQGQNCVQDRQKRYHISGINHDELLHARYCAPFLKCPVVKAYSGCTCFPESPFSKSRRISSVSFPFSSRKSSLRKAAPLSANSPRYP